MLLKGSGYPAQPEEPSEPDTFITNRRWLLGQRYVPLRLEKREKLPRTQLTHYARSGVYTISVFNRNEVKFTVPNQKPRDHYLKANIDAISLSPFDGYYMLIHALGLAFVKNNGDLIEIPLPGTSPSSTAQCWICTESEMYFLFGSVFGQIFEVAIRYQDKNIPLTQLFKMKQLTPISSLASVEFSDSRYILVCQGQSLTILAAPSPSTPLSVTSEITHAPGQVPSFIATNGKFVAWLTVEQLRIYALPDLFGTHQPACSIPCSQVAAILESDPYIYLYDSKRSIVMTQFYVVLAGPNSVVGFSVFDCSLIFRLPFQGTIGIVLPLSYSESMKSVVIANAHNFYRMSTEKERPPTNVPTIHSLREDLIQQLKSEGLVTRTEILANLLGRDTFQPGIQFIQKHLNHVLTKADRTADASVPLSQTKIQRLCEEFLMYELQICECCNLWTAEGFDPQFLVKVDGQRFDSYGTMCKLLHIRGFTPLGWTTEFALLDRVDSPLSIRKWLEQGKWMNAIEKIRQFGITPDLIASLIFEYRDKVVSIYIDKKYFSDITLSTLGLRMYPFLFEAVPPETSLFLLEEAIKKKRTQHVNMLVHGLCGSGKPDPHDLQLSQLFPVVSNQEGARLFFNPLAGLQDLQAAAFHRSAAWLAHALQLWSIAVHEAILIDTQHAKHYIHRSPRHLQADLCREVDIEYGREDGQALRLVTKKSVTDELNKMLQELEVMTKQSEHSAQFLKELDQWGAVENPEEKSCGICRRRLTQTSGYRFPCGHVCHEKCLIEVAKDLLSVEDAEALQELLGTVKLGPDDVARREKLLAGDCPLCGEKAVARIRKPITVPGASTPWSFDLADLSQFKAKKSRAFSTKF